jgi:hypothetical protein
MAADPGTLAIGSSRKVEVRTKGSFRPSQQHIVHDQQLASKFAQTDVLGGAMFEGIAPRWST